MTFDQMAEEIKIQRLIEDVTIQMKAEIGDDELTDAKSFAIKQKYGLVSATAERPRNRNHTSKRFVKRDNGKRNG